MTSDDLQQALGEIGLKNLGTVHRNLCTPALVEAAVQRHEGRLAHLGPLVVRTGYYTGRAANDKFMVDEPSSRERIWWGKVNRPFSEDRFDALLARVCSYLEGRDVFVQDCLAGADPAYEMPVRVVTQNAWHSLFARNMFLRPLNFDRTLAADAAQFTVIQAPHFRARPERDGTYSEAFVIMHLGRRLVLIGGTSYGGEIKKSIFTAMNYLLPQKGVLSMHASANVGADDDVAVFFGLSGTGKTTLSADPNRTLIGDDEHGWSDQGVFNLEGGCYAKVIRLSEEKEPEIYETTRRFGTILENVPLDFETHRLDLNDDRYTENTRASYPITHIPNALYPGVGTHPRTIVMLTADAFGVLPPIARLTPDQAMYHFLSGYTAKVAGTEAGITEPQTTFSTCFGAPFMALHPAVYADLLGKKIAQHSVSCWLINTGWSGGPYGVGKRMDISHTRAMLNAALSGHLDDVPTREHPIFGVSVPESCPGVPTKVLDPASTWSDPAAYQQKATELASAFRENFTQFEVHVQDAVIQAGPRLG
ncbi:MAG: phosphoenolpyruvate carboxykinase (ATP) [Gammaproteobacteria bacterium]|nr:MAG: phosphoenolpyruvate carboxykinase (ATP) [Gammaproteobacteria bacterium]